MKKGVGMALAEKVTKQGIEILSYKNYHHARSLRIIYSTS